ncbi:zinc finger protein basonuclin-2-like isoform X3 [Ostrea edulis]|uniref:zinc finger protein basonuclin-2-like isoform X3 n=1 Tax=Ostrea edulis TaxID=37623 RepID=UPI0024AEA778|nr:zinc finger protein basonuclin-2-like isoform X3 [Ostrea edulis]
MMKPLEAIRCTFPNCTCECFSPGKVQLRSCDGCKHGWVAHALDKLGHRHIYNLGMSVEVVQPNIVFDIASLMLYGTHATPIRLKILLDRLFSVLQHEEVLQVLQGFGWTYEDYARGYILQVNNSDSNGQVLDKWSIASREEEHVILQQFLRFGETKSIAQEIILQDSKDQPDLFFKAGNRSDSEIKKFIERNNHSMQSYMRSLDSRHLFGSRIPFVPIDGRLLSTTSSLSNFSPPSSRELRPPVVTAGMTSSSPNSGSPLGRLQTMQPFDYRRDQGSPALSPVVPDKRSGSSPSLSPRNLSSTPPSSQPVTPPFTPIKGLENQDHSPLSLAKIPMTLPILPPKDNQGINAIDYSTSKDSPVSPNSIFSDRKLKHIRKSNNPVKRQWNPSPGFGSTFIGPNGKKRVLCTACNKTFCDKGALKIHYSAVHLKEMHKCTVDGCNMMFSSRRSRNRHSANPNPKLHMPQKRVKMSDGNSLNDDSDKSLACSPPPTMVMPPTLGPHGTIPPIDGKDIHPATQAAFYAELNAHLSMFPTPEKRYKLFHNDEGPKDFSMLNNRDSKLESDGESISDKEDRQKMVSPTQRASRRKNNIPTRYKQPTENFSDDNSDEKDSSKESITEGRYYHRRSKIAESLERERSSSPHSQRYYLNLSLAEVDTTDKKEDQDSPSRRDFPKIASLLSKSPGYDSQEALDFSRPKKKVEEESEMEIDLNISEVKGSVSEEESAAMDDKEGSHVCDRCDKSFSNDASLQYHIKVMHKSNKNAKPTSEFSSRKRKTSRPEEESDDTADERESKRREDEENHQPVKCTQSNGNGKLQEEGVDDGMEDEEDRDSGTELNEICLEENEISVNCHICESKFKDNLALKEHFEVNHPKEMFNCTVKGCEKIFSTRKSRNRHSQNDNLHRHLCSEKQNGIV